MLGRGRENLDHEVWSTFQVVFGHLLLSFARDIQQVGPDAITLAEQHIERSVVDPPQWVLPQIHEQVAKDLARDSLVLPFGCRSHVVLAIDQLMTQAVVGQAAKVLIREPY